MKYLVPTTCPQYCLPYYDFISVFFLTFFGGGGKILVNNSSYTAVISTQEYVPTMNNSLARSLMSFIRMFLDDNLDKADAKTLKTWIIVSNFMQLFNQ